MKILGVEYNSELEYAIVPLGDDSLLRENNDFYIPSYTAAISCVPQFVLKTCKLGKSIGEKFASRYYNEIGVGVRFYADDLEKELKAKDLSPIMATAFTDSAALSELSAYAGEAAVLKMAVNDEFVHEHRFDELPLNSNQVIANSSIYHTLKIGDYVYCGNPYRHYGLKIDDHIQVWYNGTLLLDFYIR